VTTFDYAQAKADADELIAYFGQAATLKRPTVGGSAYNPTQGAPTSYDVIVAVLNYDDSEIDGSRVLATDKKVLMARGDLAIDPVTTDRLEIGGVEHWIIAPIRTTAPAGIVVLYELQARA
jgi:hypothetical protein